MPNAANTATTTPLDAAQRLIMRRLMRAPVLTEFELVAAITSGTRCSEAQAQAYIAGWLTNLKDRGYVWCGSLTNAAGQSMCAAAITKKGRSEAHLWKP